MNEQTNNLTDRLVRVDVSESLSYEAYRTLIDELLAAGKVTGNEQSEKYLGYTKMNIVRMNRWDKHFEVRGDLKEKLKGITAKYTWLVLSEGWCGDSAQILPLIHKMVEVNGNIQLHILLRDTHTDLMDHYLTNGTRSIPKLICISENNHEVFSWGPRPSEVVGLMEEWKKSTAPVYSKEEVKEKLHLWYARNKGEAIQDELYRLISLMH